MRYFLEAQGYGIKDLVIFQDNYCTILLEQNGKASSRKHTRHINIWYFIVKDSVDFWRHQSDIVSHRGYGGRLLH